MNKEKNNRNTNTDIVQATKEGRLYINNTDFFNQEKIKELIHKLKDSKLIKDIDKKNRRDKESNYKDA